MFDKITKNLGFITRKEALVLKQDNFLLRERLREQPKPVRPVVDLNTGDPTPDKVDARREYVARVAAFHKDVMEQKIKSMISLVRDELDKVENTPATDLLLKGTSNALWLVYDWGEQCVNEMLSYQTDTLDVEERDLLKAHLE